MAKNWFPTIDYDKCVACLQCVQFCPHGVYEERDGKPVVVNPDECVEFCRGCQKICDAKAILFPGDQGQQEDGAPDKCAEFCCGCEDICDPDGTLFPRDR